MRDKQAFATIRPRISKSTAHEVLSCIYILRISFSSHYPSSPALDSANNLAHPAWPRLRAVSLPTVKSTSHSPASQAAGRSSGYRWTMIRRGPTGISTDSITSVPSPVIYRLIHAITTPSHNQLPAPTSSSRTTVAIPYSHRKYRRGKEEAARGREVCDASKSNVQDPRLPQSTGDPATTNARHQIPQTIEHSASPGTKIEEKRHIHK
ncbi:hypothetical protein N657DRAFT_461328 [Parathielavia appendiculata]|uniref:Uncharacterized protein n=1 Tax=Parathielavia appendiculata TaxID=2587402 RepID=A0AAN6TZ43_9PEZI|nr:hypothetical protein N657DRAFT_461328 [Parathielavia appendiculata]